jgi:hypothetical protein
MTAPDHVTHAHFCANVKLLFVDGGLRSAAAPSSGEHFFPRVRKVARMFASPLGQLAVATAIAHFFTKTICGDHR